MHNSNQVKGKLDNKKTKMGGIDMFARKLLDNFIDGLDEEYKESVYSLAMTDINNGLAKFIMTYEEVFKDYPSGILLDMMEQHIKDKVFQKERKLAS